MTTTLDARAGTTSAPPETLRNYIGGHWVEADGAELLDVPNPATEELLARVPLSDAPSTSPQRRAPPARRSASGARCRSRSA